ncbi:hypothetical protein Ciccas_004433 [Cichlidogyrus casuarinus]|uniref:SOCS box domain-containing protein n=1 Tax=Cichlidogyrus casuarinus TaxID=1844966 RepID=A0ABD2QBM5_9PLAT
MAVYHKFRKKDPKVFELLMRDNLKLRPHSDILTSFKLINLILSNKEAAYLDVLRDVWSASYFDDLIVHAEFVSEHYPFAVNLRNSKFAINRGYVPTILGRFMAMPEAKFFKQFTQSSFLKNYHENYWDFYDNVCRAHRPLIDRFEIATMRASMKKQELLIECMKLRNLDYDCRRPPLDLTTLFETRPAFNPNFLYLFANRKWDLTKNDFVVWNRIFKVSIVETKKCGDMVLNCWILTMVFCYPHKSCFEHFLQMLRFCNVDRAETLNCSEYLLKRCASSLPQFLENRTNFRKFRSVNNARRFLMQSFEFWPELVVSVLGNCVGAYFISEPTDWKQFCLTFDLLLPYLDSRSPFPIGVIWGLIKLFGAKIQTNNCIDLNLMTLTVNKLVRMTCNSMKASTIPHHTLGYLFQRLTRNLPNSVAHEIMHFSIMKPLEQLPLKVYKDLYLLI